MLSCLKNKSPKVCSTQFQSCRNTDSRPHCTVAANISHLSRMLTDSELCLFSQAKPAGKRKYRDHVTKESRAKKDPRTVGGEASVPDRDVAAAERDPLSQPSQVPNMNEFSDIGLSEHLSNVCSALGMSRPTPVQVRGFPCIRHLRRCTSPNSFYPWNKPTKRSTRSISHADRCNTCSSTWTGLHRRCRNGQWQNCSIPAAHSPAALQGPLRCLRGDTLSNKVQLPILLLWPGWKCHGCACSDSRTKSNGCVDGSSATVLLAATLPTRSNGIL